MIEVPRAAERDMPPLSWDVTSAGHVILRCPNGHLGVLDHEIAEDGTVHPSVVCAREGCDFHDFIRLLHWPLEHRQARR